MKWRDHVIATVWWIFVLSMAYSIWQLEVPAAPTSFANALGSFVIAGCLYSGSFKHAGVTSAILGFEWGTMGIIALMK